MLDFWGMIDTYADRKVDRFETDLFTIDTALVTDRAQPYLVAGDRSYRRTRLHGLLSVLRHRNCLFVCVSARLAEYNGGHRSTVGFRQIAVHTEYIRYKCRYKRHGSDKGCSVVCYRI